MSDVPLDVTTVTLRPPGGAAPERKAENLSSHAHLHGRTHRVLKQVHKLSHWERKHGLHLTHEQRHGTPAP